MKKALIRITLFLLIPLLVLVGTIWTIAFKYEDDLKSFIVDELQLHLTRNIELGIKRMEYNVLSHFPNISVDIPDLLIHSLKKGDQDLVKLKEINLVFDVFSVLKGDLVLNEIFLKDGEINIIYNKDGLPNFNIWKTVSKKSKDKSSISIENIDLVNVDISYQNVSKIQDYKFHVDVFSTKFLEINDSLKVNSTLTGNILQIKQSSFFWKEIIPMDGGLEFSLIKNVIDFNFTGNILDKTATIDGGIIKSNEKNIWDIEFSIIDLGISKTVSILPNSIKRDFIKNVSGNIDLKGSIKGGEINYDAPSLEIGFKLKSGNVKSGDYFINNIVGSGVYIQPKLTSMRKAYVEVNRFSFGFGESSFSGELLARNFSNLWLSTKVKADFNLQDIHKSFLKNQFQTLNGHVNLEAELAGNLNDFINKKFSRTKNFKSKGTLNFENIELLSNNFSQPLFLSQGSLTFNNKNLNIVSLDGNLNNSHFEMTGRVSNFIETIFSNRPLTFKSNLKIDKLKVEEFISAKGTSEADSNYFFNLPKGIVLDVKLELGIFSFRKFKAKNIKGSVLLKNQRLNFDKLNFQTCSGIAKVSGEVDAKHNDKVVFECITDLERINAKQLFSELENFGQDVLLAKHVDGSVSANIYFLGETDKQLNLIKDKIYTKTKLLINNGELNDFGPLIDLQQFMSDEFKMKFDLKHLKFETLENDIEIIKKIIFIPEMAIRTNDVNLDISGKHSFDQEIDYLFKVKHSEIFKASKKNEIEQEYGVVENKDKTATLPLKMTGTVDNPKFSYDLKKKKDIIIKNLQDELKSLGKTLKNEFSRDKYKPEKIKTEKEDLNIPRQKVKLKVGDIDDEDDEEEYEEEF